MPARTVKGPVFTIVVDGKRITVKHVGSKGKRCRVIAPHGVLIESLSANDIEPNGQITTSAPPVIHERFEEAL